MGRHLTRRQLQGENERLGCEGGFREYLLPGQAALGSLERASQKVCVWGTRTALEVLRSCSRRPGTPTTEHQRNEGVNQ